MKHAAAAIVLCLVLSACGKPEAEQHTEFIQFCSANDFTPKQCEVLWVLSKSSAEASANASAAMAMSAGAMGAAVSRGSK